jgi:uncharacterized protein (DUF433 family)
METKAPLDDQGSQAEGVAPAVSPPVDRVRIVSTPGTRGGKPRIDGHRITVQDVVVWHERMGMRPDEIVSAYPTITLTDVYAALAYYFENREVIDADIRADDQFASEIEAKDPRSRFEERLRQRKADVANHPISPG